MRRKVMREKKIRKSESLTIGKGGMKVKGKMGRLS